MACLDLRVQKKTAKGFLSRTLEVVHRTFKTILVRAIDVNGDQFPSLSPEIVKNVVEVRARGEYGFVFPISST